MNPNQLRSLFEGSERLGVSYWSLYRAIETGMVKGVRLGGRVMVSEGELAHIEEFGFGPGKKLRSRNPVEPSGAEAR